MRPFSQSVFLIVALVGAAGSASAQAWSATEVRTAIWLYPEVMRDLELDVVEMDRSSESIEHHRLSVTKGETPTFVAAQPWSLSFNHSHGHFEGVVSGTVRHRGGFDLAWPDGTISLQGFALRPGREPRSLEVVAADGQVVFIGTHLHWSVDRDRGGLDLFNVDLRLSRHMATRLGRPALTGKAVGVLSLAADLEAATRSAPETGGVPNCNDWSGDQDVALINIGFVDQRDRDNGQVVMTPSATLKNVGTANVPWYSKFTGFNPPYNNDQHPFLTWSAFRINDEGIHQLGVSDIKHAFLTLNFSCEPGACTDGHILGLGCEDVYGTGTNSNNFDLAFREEILAASGVWAHCNEPEPGTPSHFDPNGDCNSGDFSPAGENLFTHGLVVQESDLADESASYIFSAWYLIRDDIDIFNTMGYREIDPQFSGSNWTFGFLSGLVNGSPLDAWVPSGADEPDSANAVLALGLGEGHLQLASQVTDLGDGYHRYDFALMNHDFDNGLEAISIPLGAGVTVRATTFRDIDQDSANDWLASIGTDAVTWTMPQPDAFQPWGTLYNFSIEANSAPVVADASLDAVGEYRPGSLDISTRAPGDTSIFTDGFESGDVTSWSEASP